METIYIDSLFLLNLLVNYFVLLATAKISALSLRRKRLGLAAALGAAYSVAVVLPGLSFLAVGPVKIAFGIFMIIAAFGDEKRLLRTGIIFFAVSAAFGGAVYAASMLGGTPRGNTPFVPVSMRILILSFAGCYAAVSIVFRRMGAAAEKALLSISLTAFGETLDFMALRDTGNELTDPMSGRKVMVLEAQAAETLFTGEMSRIFDAAKDLDAPEILEKLSEENTWGTKLRLVPYTAIGVEMGLLLAFVPDALFVNGLPKNDILVAISPTRLCETGEYCAVI